MFDVKYIAIVKHISMNTYKRTKLHQVYNLGSFEPLFINNFLQKSYPAHPQQINLLPIPDMHQIFIFFIIL